MSRTRLRSRSDPGSGLLGTYTTALYKGTRPAGSYTTPLTVVFWPSGQLTGSVVWLASRSSIGPPPPTLSELGARASAAATAANSPATEAHLLLPAEHALTALECQNPRHGKRRAFLFGRLRNQATAFGAAEV